MPVASSVPTTSSREQGAIALKVALRILQQWGVPNDTQEAILGFSSRSAFYKAKSEPEGANLSRDQLERISYLLNMHAALRTVFENPENVYGFMSMVNNNEFFNGRSPLEVIGDGSFTSLINVATRIDALRGALA